MLEIRLLVKIRAGKHVSRKQHQVVQVYLPLFHPVKQGGYGLFCDVSVDVLYESKNGDVLCVRRVRGE